jgi:carboxypeptidase C (cathepsin A)
VRSSAVAAITLCVAAAALAQSAPEPPPVVTHHQITINGKAIKYTAIAGRLPIIHNDAGEPHAYMFFIAYRLEGASAPRPITFLWNGGPGSSASQVHLLGFGPRRLDLGSDTYPTMKPLDASTPIVDNAETWLDFTDLVFVDPIGTGYSRPTKPEYGAEFYNTVGDAEAVAEFIRVYRMRYDAFNAPLFLAGESYGTVRASWVSEALERRDTHVSGIALISGYIRVGQHAPPVMEDALQVPMYTRTAHYHKKLPQELQSLSAADAVARADKWARNEYALALERRESVKPLTQAERDSIVARLAYFTGVKPALIDAKSLTLSEPVFTEHLLQDQGLDIGRYDSRMTAKRDITKIPWTTLVDPSLSAVLAVMQGTSPPMLHYFRNELEYKSDLVYRGPFGGAYPAPPTPDGDWMGDQWKGPPPAGVPAYSPSLDDADAGHPSMPPLIPPLQRAMQEDPTLRILVVNGEYDTLTTCDDTFYAVSIIEPPLRERVTFKCYIGGHMMYTDKLARQELKRDMAALVRGVSNAPK